MDSSMQKLSLFCGRGAERQSKYRETFFVDRPRCRWCSGPCISQILMAMVPFERTDQNLLEYQISKLDMAVVRLTNVYKLCSFAVFLRALSGNQFSKIGLQGSGIFTDFIAVRTTNVEEITAQRMAQ